MMIFRKILNPTDFSLHSEQAFHLACRLAQDDGAQLILLHGGRPDTVSTPYYPLPRDLEEVEHAAEGQLQALKPADTSTAVERLLAGGEPAREILRTAEASGCDLIVMGTHGRTGLSRAVTGSVTEAVLRRAPCPVLTVNARPAMVAQVQPTGEVPIS